MLLNYDKLSDKFIKTLLTANYTKNKINELTVNGIVILVRSILVSILSFMVCTNYIFIDLLTSTIISISLILNTKYIFFAVSRYEKDILKISTYFIENYSEENFRKWKKIIVVPFCIYHIIYLLIYPIDSFILILYILQFLLSYFIVDNIENRNGKLYDLYKIVYQKLFLKTKIFDTAKVYEDYNEELRDFEIIDDKVMEKIVDKKEDKAIEKIADEKEDIDIENNNIIEFYEPDDVIVEKKSQKKKSLLEFAASQTIPSTYRRNTINTKKFYEQQDYFIFDETKN